MKLLRVILPPGFDTDEELWIQIPEDCTMLIGDRSSFDLEVIDKAPQHPHALRIWNRAKEAPHAPLVDLVVARPEDHGE